MNELNQAQKTAVEYTSGPLLIVAGAGTGKTKVITEKIAYIIESSLAKPDEILALAFNDKAAGEISDRVENILEGGFVDLWVHTFHAFCTRILEKYGLEIGLPNKFKTLTATDTWMLMRENLDRFDFDYYRPLGNPAKHLHALLKHFSACKDELITPEEYLAYAESIKLDTGDVNVIEKERIIELAKAYQTYNQILLEHNYLDFSDLIFYTVKLFEKRPNILAVLCRKFKYVLVDEFQDVNWSQYKLAKMLTQSAQFTVVGDDDQSIYAFRGASVSNILRFKTDFANAREVVLTENYRSGQDILDLAYRVVKNNDPDRLECRLGLTKELRAVGGEKGEVKLRAHDNGHNEIRGIAEKIAELRANQPDLSWNDFAVLVRSNAHIDEIANTFDRLGVPYEVMSARGLYRQPVVLDAMSYLRAVQSYHENDAIYRLLNLAIFGISDNDIRLLTTHADRKSISLFEAVKIAATIGVSVEGISGTERLIAEIDFGMQSARREKPTIILFKFFERSGYLKWLTEAEVRGDSEAMRQIFELRQFFNFLDNFEKQAVVPTLDSFMKYFALVLDSGDLGEKYRPEDTPDSVNLMTVHNSKGLEFKYVFVPALIEGKFPSRNHGGEIDVPVALIKESLPEGDGHYEEERRLFYVATTRAKSGLYLSYAEYYDGRKQKCKPSRFLSEAGLEAGTMVEDVSKFDKIADRKPQAIDSKLPLPDKFSISQIKVYLTCPYQYKLDTILRIQKARGGAMSFGTSIHNTLYKFYSRVIELNEVRGGEVIVPSLEEFLKFYEESWIEDWYESHDQREKYFREGRRILKKFYEDNTNRWTVPVALEVPFSMKMGGHVVHGRIDRIDCSPEGKLEIIDYKTGKTKEKIESDDRDQLLIYQLAAENLPQLSRLGPVEHLTYLYLTDNTPLRFIGKEKDLEKFTEKIVSAIDRIMMRDFTPSPDKRSCAFCDFKNICEYRLA
ncbi:MAG TPA: ATP-dependent DNA helicase [Candidatus Magasanikbacteria bacterium]|nr:ATP-dependent DNA helicase [Candidatus Magasanikbacteria bacterium]